MKFDIEAQQLSEPEENVSNDAWLKIYDDRFATGKWSGRLYLPN